MYSEMSGRSPSEAPIGREKCLYLRTGGPRTVLERSEDLLSPPPGQARDLQGGVSVLQQVVDRAWGFPSQTNFRPGVGGARKEERGFQIGARDYDLTRGGFPFALEAVFNTCDSSFS